MKSMKQPPKIAFLFGVLAISTGVLLITEVPQWLQWLFALFWFGTGLLGVYVALRNKKT
jgi:hypothetical protein